MTRSASTTATTTAAGSSTAASLAVPPRITKRPDRAVHRLAAAHLAAPRALAPPAVAVAPAHLPPSAALAPAACRERPEIGAHRPHGSGGQGTPEPRRAHRRP